MVVLLALLFPALLLVLLLAMEKVEAPLRDEAVGEQITEFLDSARPDEVEAFVREGLARSLDRYWRRRSRGLLTRVRELSLRS
jgi:hypothetical protein